MEHASDTRAKSVKITEKGEQMLLQLVPIVASIDYSFFSQASNTEQETLAHILRKLIQDKRS